MKFVFEFPDNSPIAQTSKKIRKKRRRRCKLFLQQNGKCYYCKQDMILSFSERDMSLKTLATLEHLDDKLSDSRGKYGVCGTERTVLACRDCNNHRFKISPEKYKRLKSK